jgi:hypothetical protein
MNDIIAMARRAGAHDDGNEVRFVELRYLERFAALVRADEREEILQMSTATWFKTQADYDAAIRARGQA